MPTKRILCVEDDSDIRVMLKTMLVLSDLEMVDVPDVDSALSLIEHERFSLYVLDGGLPGIAGLSPCERIRADDNQTPIVIFSGNASPFDIEAGMLAGANAYIVKPDVTEIIPTIKRLLEETREGDRLASPQAV